MARADRVTLFDREVRERLSQPGLEILLGSADVLSEGQWQGGPAGARTYYGSTMTTLDLGHHRDRLREPCDAASAKQVADLLARDVAAGEALRQIARREASRIAGEALGHAAVELKFRWQGCRVFVDADIEGRGR